MINKVITALIGLVPASTIASIVARCVTQMLQKVKDKEKLSEVSSAVAATSQAVDVIGKAVADCQVTEDEVNTAATAIENAVKAIMSAAGHK